MSARELSTIFSFCFSAIQNDGRNTRELLSRRSCLASNKASVIVLMEEFSGEEFADRK